MTSDEGMGGRRVCRGNCVGWDGSRGNGSICADADGGVGSIGDRHGSGSIGESGIREGI
jgi:hypothetical protein